MTPPTTPPPAVCRSITLVASHAIRLGWIYLAEAHIEVNTPTDSDQEVTLTARVSPEPETAIKDLVIVCDALNVAVGTPDRPVELPWAFPNACWPEGIDQVCAGTAAARGWIFTPPPR